LLLNNNAVSKISHGTVVPGWADKIIEEFYGNLNTASDTFSLAKMTAPQGWSEPEQVSDFDEICIVLSGTLGVSANGALTEVGPGETCIAPRGVQVGYRNAGAGECHYWSICIPAFKPERNRRMM
jgi:mannose-6-phosphate isomerase-like protein (cupin superfamily)